MKDKIKQIYSDLQLDELYEVIFEFMGELYGDMLDDQYEALIHPDQYISPYFNGYDPILTIILDGYVNIRINDLKIAGYEDPFNEVYSGKSFNDILEEAKRWAKQTLVQRDLFLKMNMN